VPSKPSVLLLPVLQVLDSPFSRLTDLMLEIVVSQRLPIPKVSQRLRLHPVGVSAGNQLLCWLMASRIKHPASHLAAACACVRVLRRSVFGAGEISCMS